MVDFLEIYLLLVQIRKALDSLVTLTRRQQREIEDIARELAETEAKAEYKRRLREIEEEARRKKRKK